MFSTLPFLVLIELLGAWILVRRTARLGAISATAAAGAGVVLLLLALWAAISAGLAAREVYQSPGFLAAWPAFWVTMIPVLILGAPLAASRAARDTLRAVIDATPLAWFVGFQALRICAIGGVAKGLAGEFSGYFALFVGVPDLLFGLSAPAMLWLIHRGRIGSGAIALWNLLGAVIILPVGVVLIQMGLPGPLLTFTEAPTIATIFAFPMALAPTLVVPLFVLANLLVAARIAERGLPGRAAVNGPAGPTRPGSRA